MADHWVHRKLNPSVQKRKMLMTRMERRKLEEIIQRIESWNHGIKSLEGN